LNLIMWNMENFYDFNEEFDGTTGLFRQPTTMQQQNDSSVTAPAPITSAPSAVSSAAVR
jgi:hypothetical protein